MLFCMFAEDAGLLAESLFSKMLEEARKKPADFPALAGDLFRAMSKGGRIGYQAVEFFNGGLFENDTALPLDRKQIDLVRAAAALDWSAIDPSILGTLFERGLDPAKRSQLGAHYTDFDNIMRIVGPVVLDPLAREWEAAKAGIEGYKLPAKRRELLERYLGRLRGVTVLDPACGSGNFLYVALRGLKDLEHRVLLEAEALGLGRRLPELGPEVLRGIELNVYAAELARVSIWVGELQWQIDHGYGVARNPILKPLASIENRDALLSGPPLTSGGEGLGVRGELTSDGQTRPTEAPWPDAEFIVGNPPFLGGSLLRRELGNAATESMFAVYGDRIPNASDLCTYWFEKARAQIESGRSKRAGLIATQGIRGGANRKVLQRIKGTGDIFLAWSDLPWTLEGAAVHVSIVGFDAGNDKTKTLDGITVPDIHANLTAHEGDLGEARVLKSNHAVCFMGPSAKAPFDIFESLALRFLTEPNAAGTPNSDVLRPVTTASDLTGVDRAMWTIDFGLLSYERAVGYEAPMRYAEEVVRPARETRRDDYRGCWWQYSRPRTELRKACVGLERVLATPGVSKHRLFRWYPAVQLCNQGTLVFAVEDDYTFGVLHSRFHELWARAQGTQLREVESGFRYTPTTCFETFPFPEPTAAQRAAVGDAARELNALRENWLNPPEWTQEETLVFPATVGGPWDRWIPAPPLPSGGEGAGGKGQPSGTIAEARYVRRVARPAMAKSVAARTLTKLYNDRPAWLRHAHDKLDAAVAEAYDLPADLPDATLLAALLRLNLESS